MYFVFGIVSGLGLKLKKRLDQTGCMLAAFYTYFFIIGLVMILIFHFIFKPFHFAWLMMGIFAVYSLEIYDFMVAIFKYIHQVIQNIHYYMLLKSNDSFSHYEHQTQTNTQGQRTNTRKEYTWQDYKQQQGAYYQTDPKASANQQRQHKQQQSKQQSNSRREQAHTTQPEVNTERLIRLEYQRLLNLVGNTWTALALEKAWKKKRSELHPDRHQAKPAAVIAQKTLEFQKCQEAYAYLKLHIPKR
jgi:hypothetical protein